MQDEQISLKGVIERFEFWMRYLIGQWKRIMSVSLILGTLLIAYEFLTDPVYTAQTTFVLESSSSGGLGEVSSLASVVGLNIGDLGGNGELFQVDNIIELYRSRSMLAMTFLDSDLKEGNSERLITQYARINEIDEKWEKDDNLKEGFTFEVEDNQLTFWHDSVLNEVIKDFKEEQLIAEKLSRKLSILEVNIQSEDQSFAKRFNERLVKNVNEFYLKSKTIKSSQNLKILQLQTDSVKRALDSVMLLYAEKTEYLPNPNPLQMRQQVDIQKIQIDIQSTAAVYEEMVKNLEIAKITHRNNLPLIQIIDRPVLPLEDDKDKWLKVVILRLFLSGFLVVTFFTGKLVLSEALK